MTVIELIKFCEENETNETVTITKEAVRAIYYYGMHIGAKRICDEHSKQMANAREKALNLRYWKSANSCLPDQNEIYDSSYGEGELGGFPVEKEE